MDVVEIPLHSDGRPCSLARSTQSCPRPHRYRQHTASCYAHALGHAVEAWRDAALHSQPLDGPLQWAARLLSEGMVACYCGQEPPALPTVLGRAFLAALAEPRPRLLEHVEAAG